MKTMWKMISIILVICLMAMMVGCGSDDDDDDRKENKKNTTTVDDKTPTPDDGKDMTPTPAGGDEYPTPTPAGGDEDPTPTPTDKPSGGVYPIADQVLVDNDICTFKIVKAVKDNFWGFILTVYCENKTDKNLRFSADNVSVNGWMIDPYWAEDVAAGQSSTDDMTFNTEDFEEVGFSEADEIQFLLRVYDSDTWTDEYYVKEDFTIYPTGKSAGEVTHLDRKTMAKEQTIVDNDDYTFIVLEAIDDDFWGFELRCYVENKTDKTVTFEWEEVSVNGFEIDPYWSRTAGPGQRGYTGISFSDSAFDDNNITTVEEIFFALRIYDKDNWDADDLCNETATYRP